MGIGGAGYMTSTAYDYINEHAGFTAINEPIDNSRELAIKILEPLIVLSYYDNVVNDLGTTSFSVKNPRLVTFITEEIPVGASPRARAAAESRSERSHYRYGFNLPDELSVQFDDEILGEVVVDCGNERLSASCNARRDATTELIDGLMGLAANITANHKKTNGARIYASGANLTEAEMKAANEEVTKLIDDSVSHANSTITLLASNFASQAISASVADKNALSAKHKQDLADTIVVAKDQGFGALGTWYWTMANFNEEAGELYKINVAFEGGDIVKIQEASYSDMAAYLGRLQSISSEMKRKELADLASKSASSEVNEFLRYLNPFAKVDPAYTSISSGDPVANLQNYGHLIITASELALAGYIYTKSINDGVQKASDGASNQPIVGAAAAIASGAAGVTGSVISSMGFLLMFLLVPIFMLAMTLAFYLPSVPFILWTMALVGWLMLVIESLIAAPLWAAAHAIPEGEGMSGQHGKQGYMLFLNVLMRPPLMVFGFFISVVLMQAIGNFIGNSFGTFAAGMNANFTQGPIAFFTMMFMIGGIMVVAIHKVFGLVTWLPDNVMRWVGQQVQNLGEGNDEQRTRTIFAGAATSGGSAASQSAAGLGRQGSIKGKPAGGDSGAGGGGDTPTATQSTAANKGSGM